MADENPDRTGYRPSLTDAFVEGTLAGKQPLNVIADYVSSVDSSIDPEELDKIAARMTRTDKGYKMTN